MPYKNDGPYSVTRYGRGERTQHEHQLADAADAVEPGMLVERVEENGEIKVQRHSTDGSMDGAYVAIEARGRGMNAHNGLYDHDADDLVRYVNVSGGGVNVRLAAAEDVTPNDTLTSNGNGYLRAAAAEDDGDLEVAASVENTGDDGDEFVPTEVN